MKYEIWFELFHILTTNKIKYVLHVLPLKEKKILKRKKGKI
jgi:hypothetical protein